VSEERRKKSIGNNMGFILKNRGKEGGIRLFCGDPRPKILGKAF